MNSALVYNKADDKYLFTIAVARGPIDDKLCLRSADSTSVLNLSNNGIINFNAAEVRINGDTSVSTFDSTGATSLATDGGVVNIASSGQMTTVKGTLKVDETTTLTGNVQIGSGQNANLQIGSGVKGGQIYSTATDHELVIDPFTIDGSGSTTSDASGSVTILGNLLVQGNTTTFHSSTVDISDHNLTLAKGATTAGMADGAGITIGDASYATFNYISSGSKWATNIPLDVSGALVIADTLSVTGAATLSDTLNVTGKITATGGLDISGLDISGLNITGYLLATTPETQIPVTKSTFTLVKNNLGDLSGTNAQGVVHL